MINFNLICLGALMPLIIRKGLNIIQSFSYLLLI